MATKDHVYSLLYNFQKDYKAEIVAADLAEQGYDPEQIVIQMHRFNEQALQQRH